MQTRSSDDNSVCPSVCKSVCLSVTRVDCDKTVERSVEIYIPYERTFILVSWEEEWLVGGGICHKSCVWQTEDRQTDRRTDRILIARPRLHYMQRGKNWSQWKADIHHFHVKLLIHKWTKVKSFPGPYRSTRWRWSPFPDTSLQCDTVDSWKEYHAASLFTPSFHSYHCAYHRGMARLS